MDTYNVNEKKDDTVLYNTTLPALNDLRCAMCEIDFIEIRDSSAKSNFHWKTMKCRLLIHLVSDLIASPVSGTETFIIVITHKQFFDTGKLEKILRNVKLVYRGLQPVTIEIYKSCLIYTIQAKIAPLWNIADQYLIQGKDFYNFTEGARALKLDVLMKDMKICLKLHAEKIKISCIKLEDYLPSFVISQFLADPKGYIDLSVYNLPFIHVLPSTKKGKLLSVSKKMPPKCVFKNYDQLRRHWKNMYGYALPKTEDGILYYEIKFLIPKSSIFIYPNLCVMSGPLNIIPNRDKGPTIIQFLSDMLVKLPAVCNKKLQISKDDPFNTQLGNASSLTDTLLNNTELEIHSPQNNSTSNSHFEFSTKYVDELKKDSSSVPTSLKTRLAMIHQLHNASFGESTNTNLSIKNIRENQSDMQPKKKFCVVNSASSTTNRNFITSKEGTISRYFPIQKLHSSNNITESTQQEKQDHVSLKEKLPNVKPNEQSKISLSETDENVNIEAMAKNNQLDQLNSNILSNWLRKHSIPHNPNGKKVELIKKILSHIRNTQQLRI
nr:uncharacterized protein C18orf63-like [Osmia lignaria]